MLATRQAAKNSNRYPQEAMDTISAYLKVASYLKGSLWCARAWYYPFCFVIRFQIGVASLCPHLIFAHQFINVYTIV